MSLKSMPDILPHLMRDVAHRTPGGRRADGISLSAILAEWPKIIGDEYAAKALPTALKWRKATKTELEKYPDMPQSKGVLHITGTAGVMMELKYQEPLIISRFNLLFGLMGKQARLHSISTKAVENAIPLKPKAAKAAPIKVLDKTRTAIDGMDDPQLRARLLSLANALEDR